ncbi:MAG: hypothetical protein WKG00_38080 [Polyangiaceae bacterium]
MRSPALSKCLAASLFAAVIAVSGVAAADLGPDEVTLKNGGMLRGDVISVEPGTKVVLMEAGASAPRSIPWAEVADVERGKYADEGGEDAPGKGDTGGKDVASPSGKTGVSRVHISSEEKVQLHEELDTQYAQAGAYAVAVTRGRVACTSPCDQTIDGSRGQKFVVAGDGVPASRPFYLNEASGETMVKVDPGSPGRGAGGGVLVTIGTLGALTAATLLIVGAVNDSPSSNLSTIGGITLGASATALVGGIVMIATSGTDVEIMPRRDTGSAPARKATARTPRYWAGEF